MRLAVIVPRYGPDVLGGAEWLGRGLAEAAARQGWPVELWTTCAQTHYTWENCYPVGVEAANGLTVRRFPITHWDPAARADLEVRLQAAGKLSPAQQYAWLETGPHSAPLYEHIAAHAAEYDAVVALPYATPLIHYAAWAAAGRVIVQPCLHDEPYAYMEPTRLLLEQARGVLFNSPEEGDLATRRVSIRPRHMSVLGSGVTLPAGAPGKPPLPSPYLLYAGRLEGGKNVDLLYTYMRRYWDEGGRVRLLVLGRGPVTPPAHPAFHYGGYASEAEKAAACASALALCQPSLNESFSFTIMESWLAGRPTLVHADCPVTRGHARRSAGGLWFRTYNDFAAALDWLAANPTLSARMGRNGGEYVRRNYTWDAVTGRLAATLARWDCEAA